MAFCSAAEYGRLAERQFVVVSPYEFVRSSQLTEKHIDVVDEQDSIKFLQAMLTGFRRWTLSAFAGVLRTNSKGSKYHSDRPLGSGFGRSCSRLRARAMIRAFYTDDVIDDHFAE
jgi:hypothetical protein